MAVRIVQNARRAPSGASASCVPKSRLQRKAALKWRAKRRLPKAANVPNVRLGRSARNVLSDQSGAIAKEAIVQTAEAVRNGRSAPSVPTEPRNGRQNARRNLREINRLNGSLVVREPISTQKSRLRAMNVFHQIAAVVTEIVA